MNQSQPKHRQIVESERFTKELKALEKSARKADEFVDGAKWVLCRGPEIVGTRIGKGPVWFLPVAEGAPSIDQVVLYYAFDDESVHFLSIQKTKYPPQEPEE
jgi:hypothetical protein